MGGFKLCRDFSYVKDFLYEGFFIQRIFDTEEFLYEGFSIQRIFDTEDF